MLQNECATLIHCRADKPWHSSEEAALHAQSPPFEPSFRATIGSVPEQSECRSKKSKELLGREQNSALQRGRGVRGNGALHALRGWPRMRSYPELCCLPASLRASTQEEVRIVKHPSLSSVIRSRLPRIEISSRAISQKGFR